MAWDADIDGEVVYDAPELVVEVVDPASRINDLNNKKAAYERMGVPHYWVLDPSRPSMLVHELVDGAYERVAEVVAEEPYETTKPFPVRVVLTDLLGRHPS